MKATQYSLVCCFAAVALAVPSPQATPNLATLPTCAQAAALQAVSSSGCALTDAECFCKNQNVVQALQQAITNGCSGSDQASACAWGSAACSAYGVSLSCDASSQSQSPNAATQGSSMTASDTATSNVPDMSATNAMTTSMSSTESMRSMVTGSTSINSNNGTWTSPTTTGGPAQFTGAAGSAVNTHPGFLSMVAGIAMVFAFF